MSIDKATIKAINDGTQIAIIWDIEDVKHQAKEDGMEITEAEARDILAEMKHRHDAEYGISWTVISCYLDNLRHERKEKNGKATPCTT
ncbi:MAG: hypothetical protein KAR06_04275 [Deltaproteobacteria bacterium]|nr:hypothetical protein [Deltaproteobacteria bacterium]